MIQCLGYLLQSDQALRKERSRSRPNASEKVDTLCRPCGTNCAGMGLTLKVVQVARSEPGRDGQTFRALFRLSSANLDLNHLHQPRTLKGHQQWRVGMVVSTEKFSSPVPECLASRVDCNTVTHTTTPPSGSGLLVQEQIQHASHT